MITKSLKLNLKVVLPGDTQDDNLSVEMPTLKQYCDRNERLHSAIIPDRVVFAPEPFPETGPYRYVILDRDSKFGADVITFLKATGVKPTRTGIRSPWQNGTRNAGWEVVGVNCWTMQSH